MTTKELSNDGLSKLTEGLNEEQASAILRAFRTRTLNEGEYLQTEGKFQDFIFIILSGSVRIVRDMTAILSAGPGDYIGFDTILNEIANKSVSAIEQVEALYCARYVAAELINTVPGFATNIIKINEGRIDELEKQVLAHSAYPVSRKIKIALLELSRGHKVAEDGTVRLDGITQEFLASLTGGKRENISIQIKRLSDVGAVVQTNERRKITIRPEKLKRLIDEEARLQGIGPARGEHVTATPTPKHKRGRKRAFEN